MIAMMSAENCGKTVTEVTASIKGHETMTESSGTEVKREEILGLTSEIVAAHVSNNTVALSDLPGLIEQVYKTLATVGGGEGGNSDRPTPAVPIKKSITPDFIVCLEDGKKLKMLKRHLKTAYNMTPEEYRERWGLSPDYPMVAPNYAKQRSRLAKQIGLGTRSRRSREVA
jgi:predicted transcriptional regulator